MKGAQPPKRLCAQREIEYLLGIQVRATNLSSFVSGVLFGLFLGFLHNGPTKILGPLIPIAFFSTLLIGVIGVPQLIAQVRGIRSALSGTRDGYDQRGFFRDTSLRAVIWFVTSATVAIVMEVANA